MSKSPYSHLERSLSTILKAELDKLNEQERAMFFEDYKKKRKTLYYCYAYWLTIFTHRWYISGKPYITFGQWAMISFMGLGLLWVFADLFFIPKRRKERNEEIARELLIEHKSLRSKD